MSKISLPDFIPESNPVAPENSVIQFINLLFDTLKRVHKPISLLGNGVKNLEKLWLDRFSSSLSDSSY